MSLGPLDWNYLTNHFDRLERHLERIGTLLEVLVDLAQGEEEIEVVLPEKEKPEPH